MDGIEEHILSLREDFIKGTLTESDVDKVPFAQFQVWIRQAVEAKVNEPQAMNLATVSPDMKPSARIVYLREFENNHFWFYTNYASKKAQQLKQNSFAALTFFWPELERQIRMEGTVQMASAAKSDAYYNKRPYESKVGAWASHQSQLLFSRAELEENVAELKNKMSPETITRPEFWGGFVVKADYYEFWQGRKSRLHDRICYKLKDDDWAISRIAP